MKSQLWKEFSSAGSLVAGGETATFPGALTHSSGPNKEGMGWPTYLVVSDPEGAFTIHGAMKGGMPKGEFRRKLAALLPQRDA
ncbi:MAG: hypothetical protein OXI08_10435 [Cyanobacteria bacterium MAG IRC4_bin_6]|nr:hypothetical protein [Cyanobacteria bacterium MAG IRC4_bin_6]